MLLSFPVIGNIGGAGGNRYRGSNLPLEGFQHKFLERVSLVRAQPFISAMGDLLCLKADTSVKLQLKALASPKLCPLTVDSLVLVTRS